MSLDHSTDALPPSWQRLLALSGVLFAVLFVIGWFASGGDAPDYAAADQNLVSSRARSATPAQLPPAQVGGRNGDGRSGPATGSL